MKFLISIIIGIFSINLAHSDECKHEVIIKKEICDEEKHPIAGAFLGWLLLGPLGAVTGAVVGSNPDKNCHIQEEKHCEDTNK